MVKFSLILAIQNDAPLLKNTLDSIVENHSFHETRFECIIVDKNSNDNSEDICNKYVEKHKYFKYYKIANDNSEELSSARNFGKRVSNGQYIMFINCNNTLCPTIEDACNFLDSHWAYDFYVGNRWVNNSFWIYSSYNRFSKYGPILDSCIFRKKTIENIDFENINNAEIIYTKLLDLSGYSYYYDSSNTNISEYKNLRKEKQTKLKYSNWECEPVERLQYCAKYPYCLDNNNNIIEKTSKQIYCFDVLITNKCNLNCASCSAFSPCVENGEFFDVDSILNDLTKLSKFRDNVECIVIVGGECTLHPQLKNILTLVRKLFPNNAIQIVTNGTTYKNLVTLQDTIINNNVNVNVTLYPLDDLKEIEQTFTNLIPAYYLTFSRHAVDFGFYRKHLSTATHNEKEKILQCIKREIMRMHDGKLYICHYADEIKNLKSKFGDRIKVTDENTFIELNENTTLDEIIELKNKTIPDICYHCLDVLQENTETHEKEWDVVPWEISERKIEEFYIE